MTTSTHSAGNIDLSALDARERHSITEWVQRHVGGRVTKIQRLRRWRAVWRVELEENGGKRAVVVKSLRDWESIPYSVQHEARITQVLETNGIPVPHVYGSMEFPNAFVMDWVEGGRDPGLIQEAIEHKSTISPDRWAASLKYMEWLAKMHQIPVEQFVESEATIPTGARDIALTHYYRNHKMLEKYDAADSVVDFFTKWLERNVPAHRTHSTFVTGDCGQFLNTGPNITAILDMELGHVGDPYHDLACFRGRHPVENMGDLPALFRHYAKAMGEKLDVPVLAYHTVAFLAWCLVSPLIGFIDNHAGGDWAENYMQLLFIRRRALEAVAEIEGIALDDNIRLPSAEETPIEDSALAKLLLETQRLPTSETFQEWQRNVLTAIPQFLVNQAHYGHWAKEQDLKDIEGLLGQRPTGIGEAEKVLKVYVQKAGPDQDARLIQLFYRRVYRQSLVLIGPNASKDHLVLTKLDPILGMAT